MYKWIGARTFFHSKKKAKQQTATVYMHTAYANTILYSVDGHLR